MKYAIYYFLLILSLVTQPLKDLPETTFGAPLNTQNAEYNPIISPDGRYIVFQSDRPGGQGGMDLWLSENKNYKNRMGKPNWTEPINFKQLNTPSYEGGFSLLFDKDNIPSEIYFSSYSANFKSNSMVDTHSGKDGFDGLNIYYTKRNKNGKWSLPVHLNEINSNFDDRMPTISPDGKTMLFSSNRPGGFGKYDLWISKRVGTDKWSNPRNAGEEVNSSGNEIMPYFHFDGLSVFYSSDKNDDNYKFSFYTVDFENYQFANSKVLSRPFNSENDDEGISLTHDGIWVYYSSNKTGGEGQFDIYRAPFPEYLRKHYPFLFNGLVLDGSESTMIGIDSTIHIFNEKGYIRTITSKRIGGDLSKQDPKNFETKIETGYLYKVEVSSPGFHPTELTLDLRGNVGQNKSRYEKIVLMPIQEIKKEQPKEKFVRVILKDFMTKATIIKGKVILFTEKERSGTELTKKEEEMFVIEKLPEADFELLAKAPNYKDETAFIKKDSETVKEKKDIEIYLRKLSDIPAIYKEQILFAFNEYLLTKKQTEFLDKLAGYLLEHPKDILEVGGHTDNIATKEYNVKLSQMRADEVKKYLVKKGIAEDRLFSRAYWYSQPVGDNKTPEGRTQNRRVNFNKLN